MDYTLRTWRNDDAESAARYGNNKKIADNLRNSFPFPYTHEDAVAYVAMCQDADDSRSLLRAIDVNGEAVGSIGVFRKDDVYERSAELGYWLAEPFWGHGLMTRAVKEICLDAFASWDIVRIFAEPFARNAGSRRVLEKAGFALEGVLRQSVCKNGEVFDSCLYALLKA